MEGGEIQLTMPLGSIGPVDSGPEYALSTRTHHRASDSWMLEADCRVEVTRGIGIPRRGINRRMITKSGGIELLVKSMLGYPDDLEIQEPRHDRAFRKEQLLRAKSARSFAQEWNCGVDFRTLTRAQ